MDEQECVGTTTQETTVTKRPTTLKPLQPDTYGTGRWTYNGKNLAPYEVETLSLKGVDWEKDLMPDGRLKHPRFRFHRKKKMYGWHEHTRTELRENDAARRIRYDLLPEPRPDYFEWAALETRKEQFAQLERDAFCADRATDRLKAISTLLEFSKSKPKQTIGVEQDLKADVEWDADKIIEYGLQLKGIGISAKELEIIAAQRKV